MSAIISPCGLYRYYLSRLSEDITPLLTLDTDGVYKLRGKTVAFIAVNPSTADASIDDATVRKWMGFCKHWGAARFVVGNVFAYRATDVKELAGCSDAVGPDNWGHLQAIIEEADIVVPCWGDRAKVPKSQHHHIVATANLILRSGKPVMHLGLTKGGDPKHPLMLAYSTPLTSFTKEPK